MKKMKKSLSIIMLAIFLACVVVPAVADTSKVNINTANKDILMTLKYVGEKIAERIIEYRKGQTFNTPEEIKNVKGVGDKIYKANKNRIVVETS